MMTTGDYEVAWPRDLLRDELGVLINSQTQKDWSIKVQLLLRDAFSTNVPVQEFELIPAAEVIAQRKFLASILQNLESFPEATARRPYWSERRTGVAAGRQDLSLEGVTREFVRIVNALDERGYFEESFGKDCVDEPSPINPSSLIYERIGHESMWPLNPSTLSADRDTFLDVVEVLHDLVARPRNGLWHNYSGCGWHYNEFSREAGRRLYRWQINNLFDRSDLELLLANEGEDEGRLVEATDDARTDLVRRMAQRSDDVGHAVALFRQRDATEHHKRSAVLVLTGVLEEHRQLLKSNLLRSDEGDLFNIANSFALRHRKQDQKSDYDPVFLDWIFWWYLATIELIDRVIARGERS